MEIHDISVTLTNGMTTYPSDVPYRRTQQRNLHQGDTSNVSVIETSAHAGTHVDAPRHYLAEGYGTDKIPLEHLYGPAFVADCRGARAVTAAMLERQAPRDTKRLLLKTDNSQRLGDDPQAPFNRDFVYLDAGGARFIVERGIMLVGIDYLSIDKSGLPGKDSHHILLSHNITIVEGVVLTRVVPGRYFLACGALKMADSDGAPCRAVLIEEDSMG